MSNNETVTEQDLAERLGVPVDEVQDFLHEEIPFTARGAMGHDVLACTRCGGGQVEML